jgi:uncharacterized protein (DUF2235 family)
MTARLVLCFDGTWNKPDLANSVGTKVETNVRRFHEAVMPAAPDGTRQIAWYSPGVGTNRYERVRGGLTGYGLDEIICSGYEFLATNYADGDLIYVLGFSRGAYGARSLVGMLRKAGLVREIERVPEAYALYRARDDTPDVPTAEAFRANHARVVKVRFLGVWDTVGALGIPGGIFAKFNDRYGFHDTKLSRIVEHAVHAVAVDEHRQDYQATLWDGPIPAGQTVEQRWFVGAHCDVGGGYPERQLSDIALAWMMDQAAARGLALAPERQPAANGANALGPLHDSYDNFLFGLYGLFKGRHLRRLDLGPLHGQVIDDSVAARRRGDSRYRPANPGLPTL